MMELQKELRETTDEKIKNLQVDNNVTIKGNYKYKFLLNMKMK